MADSIRGLALGRQSMNPFPDSDGNNFLPDRIRNTCYLNASPQSLIFRVADRLIDLFVFQFQSRNLFPPNLVQAATKQVISSFIHFSVSIHEKSNRQQQQQQQQLE